MFSKYSQPTTVNAENNQSDILLKIWLAAPLGYKSYSVLSFRDVNTHDVALSIVYYLKEDAGDFLLTGEISVDKLRFFRY